ncbi:helix-turn-helix domain-containing protein [Streptomyces sp. NBC_01754]|uniref:helix-turn-helix domain-containing protein n=1 Tax=Streptomyces sp. NBC_01754 TaxID=2975930 RepID=UPI002DDA8A67|nr:helix-turn-helix domain-containing protein [Streptomyces sp. NBC_01754]WSC92857.1 helix-turn-helix domain-containing protein [Streptomyces sp. NBC_01754]
MDTQQVSAPPRAPSAASTASAASTPSAEPPASTAPEAVTPTSGVIHVNVRHVAGFTVIGNHLTQHRTLSLIAIGIAVHIQSLPTGAKIGIKHLGARFPESEARIAAALRELEATGYLHRDRVRLPNGRIITRTTSHNQPGTKASTATTTRIPQPRTGRPSTSQKPITARQPHRPLPAPVAAPAPPSAPSPVPLPTPQPTPAHSPAPTARTAPPPPPLPRPSSGTPELHRAATALLADLRRHAPQLVLSERDIETLTPGVSTWLERDAHPDTVRHVLTADLPVPLKHPAKLLRHRITALLPPPLPGAQDLAAPTRPRAIVIPLQNCDHCDRTFRSRRPGHCRDCRESGPAPTAA